MPESHNIGTKKLGEMNSSNGCVASPRKEKYKLGR